MPLFVGFNLRRPVLMGVTGLSLTSSPALTRPSTITFHRCAGTVSGVPSGRAALRISVTVNPPSAAVATLVSWSQGADTLSLQINSPRPHALLVDAGVPITLESRQPGYEAVTGVTSVETGALTCADIALVATPAP